MYPTSAKDIRPILVIVEDGKYLCYSLASTPSFRDQYLMAVLKEMGGVNESVPEGRYHFNITAATIGKTEHAVVVLQPAE